MLTFKQFLAEMPIQNTVAPVNKQFPLDDSEGYSKFERPRNPLKYRYHGSFKNPKTGKRFMVYSHSRTRSNFNHKGELEDMQHRTYFAHSPTKRWPSAMIKLVDKDNGTHDVEWAQSSGGFGIHHLYTHILRRDKRVKEISSNSQSPGAIKAWKQLASDPSHDVFVRKKGGPPRKSRDFNDYYKTPYIDHDIVVKKR